MLKAKNMIQNKLSELEIYKEISELTKNIASKRNFQIERLLEAFPDFELKGFKSQINGFKVELHKIKEDIKKQKDTLKQQKKKNKSMKKQEKQNKKNKKVM